MLILQNIDFGNLDLWLLCFVGASMGPRIGAILPHVQLPTSYADMPHTFYFSICKLLQTSQILMHNLSVYFLSHKLLQTSPSFHAF